MAWQHERSLLGGNGQGARFVVLLLTPWVLGCANRHGTTDAEPGVPDADSRADEGAVGIAPNLDGRIGLASGSSCDASAQCLSGACTLGVCSDWAHAMQIVIDTTSAGADVNADVEDFPLLVRLSESARNFAFSEARQGGADIRFVDAKGNNLSYEIERWDTKNAVAELWVLVPHIGGNSRNNFVLMYWGNPLAAPISSGPSVFSDDSLVFHMAEDLDNSPTHIQDDSGQGNTGLVQSQAKTSLRGDGIAGDGLALDGISTYLATTLRLTAPQPVSISLWLKVDSASKGGIAGFASKQSGNDVHYDRAIEMDSHGLLSFAVQHDGTLATVSSLEGYGDGQWHFIVARFSRSGQYLFVDGESIADDPATTSADAYQGFWRFGQEPALATPSTAPDAAVSTGDFISGSIDEIRIATDERSEAWIKLSYATQLPRPIAVVYSARH